MTKAELYSQPMSGLLRVTERTKGWVPTDAGPGISAGYLEPGRYPVEAFGRVTGGGISSEHYVVERSPGERVAVRASACEIEPA
jgi:hypothetical protein